MDGVQRSLCTVEVDAFYTPLYASPELAQAVVSGGAVQLSRSMDMWSFGITVLDILCAGTALQEIQSTFQTQALFGEEDELAFLRFLADEANELYWTTSITLPPSEALEDKQLQSLLDSLIVKSPASRLSASEVLAHPYLRLEAQPETAKSGVPEKRVDPSDGVTYTIQELRSHYANVYTAAEIEEYWHTMTPVSTGFDHPIDLGAPQAWRRKSTVGAAATVRRAIRLSAEVKHPVLCHSWSTYSLDAIVEAVEEEDEEEDEEESDTVAELPSVLGASKDSGKDSPLRLVSSTPKFRSSVQEFNAVPQFNPRMSMLAEGDEEEHEDDEESTPVPQPLDAKAALSGWLGKRGPMFGYRWSQFWCVLESTGITYYSDEQCSKKKGDLLIGATTQALPFRDCTIGESVKHLQEKPLGFVVDIDPAKGKSRKLHYFDAGSEDALQEWTDAIGQAARKLLALEMFPSEVGYGKFGTKKT